jgi:hypothetical protein
VWRADHPEGALQKTKAIIAIVLTGAFVALCASDASARGWGRHYGPGPVLGIVGGVLAGAVAIATLPFVVVGAVIDPGPRREGYYEGGDGYYGRDYAPPPPRGYYGRGYYGDDYGYGRR